MIVEPLYTKKNYIVNRAAGDIAIVKGVTKKGYYQFIAYYDGMFDELKDLDKYKYELQVNYQKFWEPCNEEEKKKIDELVEKQKETSKK